MKMNKLFESQTVTAEQLAAAAMDYYRKNPKLKSYLDYVCRYTPKFINVQFKPIPCAIDDESELALIKDVIDCALYEDSSLQHLFYSHNNTGDIAAALADNAVTIEQFALFALNRLVMIVFIDQWAVKASTIKIGNFRLVQSTTSNFEISSPRVDFIFDEDPALIDDGTSIKLKLLINAGTFEMLSKVTPDLLTKMPIKALIKFDYSTSRSKGDRYRMAINNMLSTVKINPIFTVLGADDTTVSLSTLFLALQKQILDFSTYVSNKAKQIGHN